MKYTRKSLVGICLLLIAGSVLADSDHDKARQLREAGDILSLEKILQKVQSNHPGKVLEVELETKHDKLVYEIELLDAQGKVWKLKVNPHTGELLQRKEDD